MIDFLLFLPAISLCFPIRKNQKTTRRSGRKACRPLPPPPFSNEKRERQTSPSHALPPPPPTSPPPQSQMVICFLNLPSSSAPWKVLPLFFFGNKRLTQCELFGANFRNLANFFQKMEKKKKTHKHTHTQTHFFCYFDGFSRHFLK